MINTIKVQLAEVIKQRSRLLIELAHTPNSLDNISIEIDSIRKLKDAYDLLDEAC